MAELLRLESSRFYGSNNSGCIWDLFHIFDSYRRSEKKRMISYRRMGGHQYGVGTDNLMEKETGRGQNNVTNKAANSIASTQIPILLDDDEANKMNKSSGKTRILNFISKKLLKRQKHKGKMSHQMCTTSNHNSESNANESCSELNETADSDIYCVSNKIDRLENHLLDEHIILKEKLFEARDALLKKKDSNPKGMAVEFSLQSKIFLETLHLFNTNREALYNVCKDQDSFMGNDIEVRKQGETKTVLSRLKELKQRLKDVIGENKKEQHFISMDRILDKVPFGYKLQQCEKDKKMNPRVGRGFKINRMGHGSSSIGKFGHQTIQRSRSLTESLDRYSQLMDSIAANEVRKAPERSNSNGDGKMTKTHRRMPSNPEFLSSYSFIKDVQSDMYVSFELPMQTVDKEIVCEQEEFLETIITETEGHERFPSSVNECLEIVPFQFSKTLEEINDLFYEQKPQIEDERNVKPEIRSPISVLDTDIEEPVSALKFSVMAGSNSQQLLENIEEQLSCPQALKNPGFNELNIAELSKPNFNEETSSTTIDQANSFLVNVNEKEAARFNYVKHILSKSGYEALLFEPDDSSFESAPTNYTLSSMPFEEQLIYDLINEVLFQIYEYYTAPSSWLSRFHPKITSMPSGSYLVGEVWEEIRWHLSSPQDMDTMADKILARNFTKSDDWMNLYRDAECFGLLLEQLLLDDLVDEVILDIDEL